MSDKISGLNLPIRTSVDTETYDYLQETAKKRGIPLVSLVASILKNENEKAKRRPKVTIEKE